jgi:hypothetical protein
MPPLGNAAVGEPAPVKEPRLAGVAGSTHGLAYRHTCREKNILSTTSPLHL